jgi:acyl-coenzyme A thioesterase PaaI-like protein
MMIEDMPKPGVGEPSQSRRQSERDAALRALTGSVPYNCLLGVRFDRLGDELTGRLPYKETLIGNPVLPALHGGVTGSFLEITALMQLAWDQVLARMDDGAEGAALVAAGSFPRYPKTIDITIDYLRPGLPRETFARAVVQKAGRRVANLHVEAWQDSRSRPIALLRGNFLMPVDAIGR